MGLFDKKYCSICGEKIGLLGNRKLEDGNLCKDCAKQLSPWFSERRHSTVEEIKQQLAYRSDNKEKVARFKVTRSFGEYWRVLIDDTHRWFAVTHDRSLSEANPDILSFDNLTECRLDIDESSKELKRKNKNGDMGSYNPDYRKYRQMADELVAAMNAISWVPALMRSLGSPKISQRHSLPHGIARPAVRQTAVSSANIAERRTLTH